MKKTISVNIKGLNFLIEEDAYVLLQDYLERLKTTLRNEEGSQEIIEDVELRIAELCSSKLSESKTVIELTDIQSILNALGNPQDYVHDDEEQSFEKEEYRDHEKSDRRLYRDTDGAVLGGVCSGIANYFNIDVVIIRAIFVLMFLFAGFGFPLYIIMWVIIPKAKSTIDRLRMKGRPITVETVKEEVEIAAQNISKGSKKFAQNLRNDDSYQRSISRGARIVSTIFGIGFVGAGLLLLIPFLIFIIGGFEFIPIEGDHGFLSFTDFGDLVLNGNGDFSTMWIGGLMMGFSAVLFLLLIGFMLIFRLKNKWTRLSLFGLFLTGLTGFILCSVVGISSGKDFAQSREIEYSLGDVYAQELTISPLQENEENGKGFTVKNDESFHWIKVDENRITQFGINFEYVRSSDSLFHIKQSISARSVSKDGALTRCENVEHRTKLDGTHLFISPEYSFPRKDKLRDQEITIIVEIPEGAQVRFKDHIISLGEYSVNGELIEAAHEEEGYLKASGKYRHYD